MKVENIKGRTGKPVANQFIILIHETLLATDGVFRDFPIYYMQSYQTIVVRQSTREWDKLQLDPKWDCSKTTTKYVAQFLGETPKEIRQKIKSGEYVVIDLN